MTQLIPFEAEAALDWLDLTDALAQGHSLPKGSVKDVFLYQDDNTLLNRTAWIPGMGLAVKCATVFPGNTTRGKPMIAGAVNLFSDEDGALQAILDFALVTKWKTAGDSLLAARRLARPDARAVLIVGAGTVGRSIYQAYGRAFPGATFTIWNRTPAGAARFADDCPGTRIADDLETAVRGADIIIGCTMTTTPIIRGDWLQPGQHIDLIGAYRPDMREVDDTALQRARLFVDSFETTCDHIGELKIPLESGAIQRSDIIADFYDLSRFTRLSDDDITLCKNGGGAHLDLMTSRYIQKAYTHDHPDRD